MNTRPDNLLSTLMGALPVSLRHIPDRLRDVGRNLGMRTALCGGIPRDLLRVHFGQLQPEQIPDVTLDFDVVVEGNAVQYAKELVRRLPGKLVVNEAFSTATLTTNDHVVIDIVSARNEEYPTPGSLPVVATAGVDLAEDMLRRDFSINALALDLSDNAGELVDPTGGLGDIRDRNVRILHSASFSDDPTRLFRALRYSVRLEYDLEPTTQALFTNSVDEGVTDHLTPERVRYELECIGREERWAEIWAIMDLTGLATSIAPGLGAVSRDWSLEDAKAMDVGIRNKLDLLEKEGVAPWLARTAWVLQTVRDDLFEREAFRLGMFPRHVRWIASARQILFLILPRLLDVEKPSEVSQLLDRHPRQGVVLATFIYKPESDEEVQTRKEMLRYVESYSQVRSELSGDKLMELGFKPGPLLGEVRDQLRYLRMDGVITSVAMEMDYARQFLSPLVDDPQVQNEGEDG